MICLTAKPEYEYPLTLSHNGIERTLVKAYERKQIYYDTLILQIIRPVEVIMLKNGGIKFIFEAGDLNHTFIFSVKLGSKNDENLLKKYTVINLCGLALMADMNEWIYGMEISADYLHILEQKDYSITYAMEDGYKVIERLENGSYYAKKKRKEEEYILKPFFSTEYNQSDKKVF